VAVVAAKSMLVPHCLPEVAGGAAELTEGEEQAFTSRYQAEERKVSIL
jgi:hypothetical protein